MLLTMEKFIKNKREEKCQNAMVAFGSWDYRQIFSLIFLYLIHFPKFLLGACIAFMIRNNKSTSETLTVQHYKYLHMYAH